MIDPLRNPQSRVRIGPIITPVSFTSRATRVASTHLLLVPACLPACLALLSSGGVPGPSMWCTMRAGQPLPPPHQLQGQRGEGEEEEEEAADAIDRHARHMGMTFFGRSRKAQERERAYLTICITWRTTHTEP